MTSSGAATADGFINGSSGSSLSSNDEPPVAPEPVNITQRIRREHDLGINSFAELAGVNAQTILRTDQGTYGAIPGKITQALMRLDVNYTENHLQSEYAKYVRAHRRWACTIQPFSIYGWIDYRVHNVSLHGHPLKYRRIQSGYPSVMGFCTAYCLHPSTIRRFESGKTLSVPLQLREMLRDLDYGAQDIEMLQQRHDEWIAAGRPD